jgi:alanine dehydrogenase
MSGTLLLTRGDVQALLRMDECVSAVEEAFRAHAEGRAIPPGVLASHVKGGGFHLKTAGLHTDRAWFAAKLNGNFPGNRERFGLPTIQGVVVLADAERGTPLAVMDSMEITMIRTAAATAVAAKYLSREGAGSVAICGAGAQARSQLRAVAAVRPVRSVRVFDLDAARARGYASEMSAELRISVEPASAATEALRGAEIIVTCTSSRRPYISHEQVSPGAFIAAVGADSEDKSEIDPELMARGAVVTDILEQCARIGDLHHAIAAGTMTEHDVRAELGDVVAGRAAGRISPDEIMIFDSTGTALQDVAAATIVYRKAVATGRGMRIDFGA